MSFHILYYIFQDIISKYWYLEETKNGFIKKKNQLIKKTLKLHINFDLLLSYAQNSDFDSSIHILKIIEKKNI